MSNLGEEGSTPEDQLLKAVQHLSKEVGKLNERAKHFPTRDEVKSEGRKRAAKVLAFGVVLILVAQLFTMATISYCFLSPLGADHSSTCGVMPGYASTQSEGKARLARFELVISQIEKNRMINREQGIRIRILQEELRQLKEARS